MKLLAPIKNDEDIVNKKYVDTAADELQSQVNNKADKEHNHDDRYYTESEVDSKVSGINKTISDHISNTSNPHGVTKSQVGLGNVENKSSETIRGELTKSNVTTALGYTPYTPNEVDNKFAALETNIDWKESVDTFSDIATTYPNPEDGWTVNVKDTDYTYRYNGTTWVAISANAIPKATDTVDGLLSKEDHAKYEDANNKKHTHDNKSVLDGITSALVNNWNAAKTHADSAHAPSNAEVNQNAFSIITVGTTNIAADSKTDTLTLVAGDNITLIPDATNDKITIKSEDTVYTHPTHSAYSSGLYKITVDALGHVAAATAVVKTDITGLGIPGSDTNSVTGLKVGTSATATANAAATNGNVYLNVLDDSTVRDSHNIVGSGSTTVTSDANGKITINSTDTKVNISSADEKTARTYYPTLHTSTSGASVSLNSVKDCNIVAINGTEESAGYSVLRLGNNIALGTAGNKYGQLTLYSKSSGYSAIRSADTTEVVSHMLPATSGTILNTGTTSFIRSLTSGTKIGTIKINDTSTDIYAPTNTDTQVTNTLATTTKAYITGTTSSTTNTGTQVFDTGVYLDTVAGHLTATQFNGKLNGNATSASKVNNALNINGVSYDGSATKDIDLLPFIVGTQTAVTGTWTGNAPTISALVDGLTIRYWLPYAGSGNATLNLTLADGKTTTGNINCYYGGTSRLTTHYGAGNIITLTYRKNVSIAGSTDTYTGWWADANYNSNNRVQITTTNPSSSSTYYIPFSNSASSSGAALLANDGFRMYSLQGTDSAVGYDIPVIGNSIPVGTAGNKYGAIRLYSQSAYYGVVTPIGGDGLSSNRTWAFPDKNITVAGTSSFTSGNFTTTTSSLTKKFNISKNFFQVRIGGSNINPLANDYYYSSCICPKGTAYSASARLADSNHTVSVSVTSAGTLTITVKSLDGTGTHPVTYYIAQFD